MDLKIVMSMGVAKGELSLEETFSPLPDDKSVLILVIMCEDTLEMSDIGLNSDMRVLS